MTDIKYARSENANAALNALQHKILFNQITIGDLIVDSRTKLVHKGQYLGKPVAVCISKLTGSMVNAGEAEILAKIGRHPNIVRFIARSTDNQGREVLVLDFAPHGNLHTVVSDEFDNVGPWPDRVLWEVLDQVASGMEELHAQGIIHKDLALRNILVYSFSSHCPERMRVKVADLGMSSVLEASAASSSYYYSGQAGTALPVRWMAPESLTRNKWSEKSDVFSFGVLVWELSSGGQLPWGLGMSDAEVQRAVTAGQRLECVEGASAEVRNLVTQCCVPLAKDRPSFADIKGLIASFRGRAQLESASNQMK